MRDTPWDPGQLLAVKRLMWSSIPRCLPSVWAVASSAGCFLVFSPISCPHAKTVDLALGPCGRFLELAGSFLLPQVGFTLETWRAPTYSPRPHARGKCLGLPRLCFGAGVLSGRDRVCAGLEEGLPGSPRSHPVVTSLGLPPSWVALTAACHLSSVPRRLLFFFN